MSLNRKFPGYPYDIVFSKMIQINKRSKRKRKVRRSENAVSYPLAGDSSSDNNIETDKKIQSEPNAVQEILDPNYLASEVPGTADLINQVNSYKRNVEISETIGNLLNRQNPGNVCSPQEDKTDQQSHPYVL